MVFAWMEKINPQLIFPHNDSNSSCSNQLQKLLQRSLQQVFQGKLEKHRNFSAMEYQSRARQIFDWWCHVEMEEPIYQRWSIRWTNPHSCLLPLATPLPLGSTRSNRQRI